MKIFCIRNTLQNQIVVVFRTKIILQKCKIFLVVSKKGVSLHRKLKQNKFNHQKSNTMTQQEFEERVNMKVSADEFNHINIAYMNIGDNVTKDMFCSAWASWNKERISEYNAKIKEVERIEKELDFLRNCFAKIAYWKFDIDHPIYAYNVFNKTEMRKLEDMGIFRSAYSYTASSVRWELYERIHKLENVA